jgi:hypothetical protein
VNLAGIGRGAEAGSAEHDTQDGQSSEDELLHGTLHWLPRVTGLVVIPQLVPRFRLGVADRRTMACR